MEEGENEEVLTVKSTGTRASLGMHWCGRNDGGDLGRAEVKMTMVAAMQRVPGRLAR